MHETTNCGNFTPATLQSFYANDIASWKARFPSLPNPVSNRTHCIVFSDWASQPKTELANGMRMDGNYYYWPGTWIQDRPGFMTGSGMPMRFTDTDGSMIDIYQAPTQMTDESGQSYPLTPNTLLDNATGPLGYYGAFNANMHTDSATTFENDSLISSAQARGVPLVSGKQMVTWLDGRNASSFTNVSWSANTLELRDRGRRGRQRFDRHAAHGGTQRHPALDPVPRRHCCYVHHEHDQGSGVRLVRRRQRHLHRGLRRDGGSRHRPDRGGDHPGPDRRSSRRDLGHHRTRDQRGGHRHGTWTR